MAEFILPLLHYLLKSLIILWEYLCWSWQFASWFGSGPYPIGLVPREPHRLWYIIICILVHLPSQLGRKYQEVPKWISGHQAYPPFLVGHQGQLFLTEWWFLSLSTKLDFADDSRWISLGKWNSSFWVPVQSPWIFCSSTHWSSTEVADDRGWLPSSGQVILFLSCLRFFHDGCCLVEINIGYKDPHILCTLSSVYAFYPRPTLF